ncbi:hypothetical protein [Paraburkholderia atlantica]|uniref:hypothetical protein n=1 Tax=Paraburkholderia atlantica TaxID=2654982 RepID=UPI001EE67655|nr:hypothetical protein [Paraburkholderia atlantica]
MNGRDVVPVFAAHGGRLRGDLLLQQWRERVAPSEQRGFREMLAQNDHAVAFERRCVVIELFGRKVAHGSPVYRVVESRVAQVACI